MMKYLHFLLAYTLLFAGNTFAQAKKDIIHAKPVATAAKKDTTHAKKTLKLKKDTVRIMPVLAVVKEDTIGMSPLKTMTYAQYKAYIDGVDLSHMAVVAELNHYPDPQKVLSCTKELGLSATQITDITTINTGLQRKMKEMGALIIKNETTLDNLFRSKKVDDGTLIFYGQRTDLFKGELRNAILQTFVKVQAILTTAQRKKYEQLHKSDR